MKRLFKKINSDRLYFTIFMVVALFLFLFITSDIDLVSSKVSSLGTYFRNLFDQVYNHTYYGKQMVGELIWIMCLLPVLLLFKNKYIFTQKSDKFWPTVLKAWPILAVAIVYLITSIVTVAKNGMNGYELVGLIIFTLFIGIFEEFMCRGWVQNEFIERFGDNRKNVIYSILVSSILFGFMHITNVFFNNQSLTETLLQIFNATILGVALGAVYYKSKNIWVPVFFHAFWDFAVMLSEINFGTTCVIPSTPSDESILLLIVGLFIIAFQNIPQIYTALTFLGKKELNEELPKENRETLTKDDLKKESRKRKELNIFVIAYISMFAIVNLTVAFGLYDASSILEEAGIDEEETEEVETCPVYYDREVYNAQEMYATKDKTDISVKYSVVNNCSFENCMSLNDLYYDYRVYINSNDKLVIEDLSRNLKSELKYKNVVDYVVVDNNGVYDISFITMDDNFNFLVYHSDFMTKDSIESYPNFLNSLESTFTRVLLPDIYSLGTYKEDSSSYVYPLYVSSINDKYILDYDGKIFKLKDEEK